MEDLDLHFPFAGVDVAEAFSRQPNRPAAFGRYARTTPIGQNVRTFDSDGRARGGMRQGLTKFIAARPGNTRWVTQNLTTLVLAGASPVQPSQLGRDVRLVAVSQGNVYYVSAGGSTWNAAANGTSETPPLNITGLMQSAVNNQLLFFADGTNWCYYDPTTGANGTVKTWAATSGTLPVDSAGNTPRLICTWRGRTVLAGLLLDPCNWFMSAVSDPFDFDYAPPLPVPPSAAVSGNVAPQGFTGNPITCLIPYSDDRLIMGMNSKIAVFNGDPNAGGQIDIVTDSIGIVGGDAWAMDPEGIVYFFSNLVGVFRFVPGSQPERISHSIDNLLHDIDTGEYNIALQWNDRYEQLHVWVTLLSTTLATTHYVWEKRSNSWWQDTFANPDHNPLCRVSFDGNEAADRMALIGGFDGYIRSVSSGATTDDGTDIVSEVWVGPFLTKFNDSVMLQQAQGVLGEDSGDVNYEIYVGQTAEEALASTAVASGTWTAGRNHTDYVKRAGYAAYIRITSAARWAMENIRCFVGAQGETRRRGK